jgi:O-phosphoseryl-tRNA(Cys) synthetase
VVLGWFGLLFGMFSPIVPPFAMISPLVLLGLGISVLVMASRDLEDIRQGRLPPDFKSRARHAQVVGVLNLLAVLLCGALAVALFWFFANWSH